jgi:hypothetical protein
MENNGGGKMNIGASSLVLILIVLTLSTLGILALSSAKSDLNLARKNAAAIQDYYQAENSGEEFLQKTDRSLREIYAGNPDREKAEREITAALGGYYDGKSNSFGTDISMNNGLALRISAVLNSDPARRYTLNGYYVYIRDDYEIDQTRPVWTGN